MFRYKLIKNKEIDKENFFNKNELRNKTKKVPKKVKNKTKTSPILSISASKLWFELEEERKWIPFVKST